MTKELKILSILSALTLIIYIFFPKIENNDEIVNVKAQNLKKELSAENKVNGKKDDFSLTFDIVRVSPSGETLIAGKSEPNISML